MVATTKKCLPDIYQIFYAGLRMLHVSRIPQLPSYSPGIEGTLCRLSCPLWTTAGTQHTMARNKTTAIADKEESKQEGGAQGVGESETNTSTIPTLSTYSARIHTNTYPPQQLANTSPARTLEA